MGIISEAISGISSFASCFWGPPNRRGRQPKIRPHSFSSGPSRQASSHGSYRPMPKQTSFSRVHINATSHRSSHAASIKSIPKAASSSSARSHAESCAHSSIKSHFSSLSRSNKSIPKGASSGSSRSRFGSVPHISPNRPSSRCPRTSRFSSCSSGPSHYSLNLSKYNDHPILRAVEFFTGKKVTL
jgi:hypothetical protein